MSSDPKHPKLFVLMISMILSSFIVGLFHKAMIFQIPINHPWTPKLWKMKVLTPNIWVITPKTEGFGFPWQGVFHWVVHITLWAFMENHLRTFWGNDPSVDVAFNGSKGRRFFFTGGLTLGICYGMFHGFSCMRDSWILNTETYRNMCVSNDMQTADLENISKKLYVSLIHDDAFCLLI